MADLPVGAVTFLFTDIEGSTRLLGQHPEAYRAAVRRHHDLLTEAVEAHEGVVFETVGDAVYAAFARPTDALKAALQGQLALQTEPWVDTPIKVRMGMHHGEVEVQGAHYFGVPLYRCARLMSTVHGGQVVLSEVMAGLVRDALPEGATLTDLGEHRLQDLGGAERIFQLLHPGLAADFPPLRTLDTLPNNLPLQVTSFVGREHELVEVRRLLTKGRLVTLTGPGGTGKTRLALQVAADALAESPDGVWLIELAALADPVLVPQAVAAALGVREAAARPLLVTLTDALRPKRLLVVLDNCEHLVDACARLADALLRTCPHVRVLATSREALGIAGETPWRVPSLSLPDAGQAVAVDTLTRSEAVRLFIERAATVQPAFAVTERNAPVVAALCAHLDGIPLALELAAARLTVLPVEQLLDRLQDRFRLLTGESRTALPRQQTLRAAVDWSYDLLSDQEKTLFNRLSVFAGGFTLEAAEAVCPGEGIETWQVLDLLSHLVEKSLVVLETSEDGGGRYRLLETLREYAHAQLAARGEQETSHQAHTAHYLGLAEAAELKLSSAEAGAWLPRLEAEHDNLRSALHRALTIGDADTALRLSTALWQFWYIQGYLREGGRWLEQALSVVDPALGHVDRSTGSARTSGAVVRAKALNGAGVLAHYLGEYGRAAALCGESLSLCRQLGDGAGTAAALNALALVARSGGDFVTARAMYRESIGILEALGDKWGLSYTLRYLGVVLWMEGDYTAARPPLEQGLALARQVGDRGGISGVLHMLGYVSHSLGDDAAAEAFSREALSVLKGFGARRVTARALWGLGGAAAGQGHHAEARAAYQEALTIFKEVGEAFFIAACLSGLAAVALAYGLPRPATRLLAADSALRASVGAPRPPCLLRDFERNLQAARAALDEAAFNAAWAAGQALSVEEAIAEAMALGEPPCPPPPSAATSLQAVERGVAPLTAREVEVVRLIARGLTNKQIAAELVIAEGTADRHVSNILGKLDVATRAQVAAWATEQAMRVGGHSM